MSTEARESLSFLPNRQVAAGRSLAPLLGAALLALTACAGGGGGSSPTPDPTAAPTAAPTATPTPVPTAPASSKVVVSPTSVSFSAAGTAYAQTVTVSQANNVGGFTTSGCPASIVTVPPTTTGQLTIAPVAAGICTITVTGSSGTSAQIGVTVTTTNVVQQ